MSVPRFTLGWVYNLDEVPSTTSTSSVIGLACAFPSIAVLSVLARIALRRSKILSLGLDDFAVAASAVSHDASLERERCFPVSIGASDIFVL